MKLSEFEFPLLESQVALEPHRTYVVTKEQDGKFKREVIEEEFFDASKHKGEDVYSTFRGDRCKMMVVHRKSEKIDMYKTDGNGSPLVNAQKEKEYIRFEDIVNYFGEGDTFVLNNTKVFPARMFGTKEKTDAQIEVFLLRELNEEFRLWDVLVEPARKIRIGNKLFFDGDGPMVAEVIDNTTSRGRTLRFLYDCPHDEFKKELFALGTAPMPYYIYERREVTPEDMEKYQTVYASEEGAVTAPATGLHFSRELLKKMEIRGINSASVTMHCGLSCFDPIEVEDLTKHKTSSEQISITPEACDIVNKAKADKRHICCVGISTLRTTESSVGTDGLLKEYNGWTNRFIFPPYQFGLSDSLVTNLYHPKSTMMMAACAFGGYELVFEAYKMAAENGYSFGCFGDAMLILDD